MVLGVATVGFLLAGLLVDNGGRLLVASGAFGLLWWAWDIVMDWMVRPIAEWIEDLVTGGRSHGQGAANMSVDHRIAVLERRLRAAGTQRAYVQAAMRLAELHELQKRDRDKAREVIATARARFPDVEALEQYERKLTPS